MIKTKNLTRVYETINYNVVALSNLNFEFEKGEVVVVLGRSGSGKSTFLNILGGFDHNYSGSYFFGNYEFKNMDDSGVDELRSKKIGFIFQHQVLFNNLTVVENVEMALNVLGVDNNRKKRLNAMKALTLVGLRRHAFKKPWQLSGGERQRVAIARAIVKDPDVIICDEPTAALDSLTSKEILDLLASVCKDKLLIIATHNKSIVKNYGTRLLELKSGYVVRDELIKEDKSNIQLDELDKLVDQSIYEEEIDHLQVTEFNEEETKNESKILNDLDLSGYKNRKEEEFFIDEAEKGEVLRKRREKVKKEEKFDSFDGLNQSMTNMKRYAFSSVLNQRRTYLFFAFFLVSFIFVMIVGLNLSSRLLLKTDNTQEINQNIFEQNKLVKFSNINKTELLLDEYDYTDKTQVKDLLKDEFTQNTNLDPYSSKANPVIINDSSFKLNYHSKLYQNISQYLDREGYANNYSMYYDLNNIVIGSKNNKIIFDSLKRKYQVYNVEQPLSVNNIAGTEVDFELSYMYVENNLEFIEDKLIGEGEIPSHENEVLVSIKTLIDYNIVNNTKTNKVSELYQQFKELDEDQKYLTLKNPVINLTEDENGTMVTTETVKETRFKIVGVYHASDQIESYYINSDHRMMFFSKDATSLINVNIENEIPDSEYELRHIPLYMEVNKTFYQESNLDKIIKELQVELLNDYYNDISTKLDELKEPLQSALLSLKRDLEQEGSMNTSEKVDVLSYGSLTYNDILYEYVSRYIQSLDSTELSDLCNTCVTEDQSLEDIKAQLPTLINKINRDSDTYNQMLHSMSDTRRLVTEQVINSVIYETYYTHFNNTYYSLYGEDAVNAEEAVAISYENDLQKSSYYKLYSQTRNILQNDIPLNIKGDSEEINKLVVVLGKIIIDRNMITTVMATVASSALIILFLYVLAYMISKLFGNIYQLFFVNRQKEFISLKILGAKFADIKRIIKLEGNIFVIMTYLIVLILLGVFYLLLYTTRNSSAFMMYLYEASTDMFININVFDFFNISIITLINVLILMKLLFKRQLIDQNIDKRFKKIDSIDSIENWDGE